MSEKTQESRVEQEDLIEQIIAQGLDRMKAPVRTEDAPEPETPPAPKQEDAGEAAPPADRKNPRSAAYLYLLILFGAALLMLLLAYFIQRRSSENTISDLRDTMNLSRAELLAQIKELEEENDELRELIDLWQNNSHRWETRYEEKDEELTDLWDILYTMQEEVYCYRSFLQLEQYYQAGDLESCAAILLLQVQNQTSYHAPDGMDQQQEEIVKAVIRAGILDEDYLTHIPDYEALLDAYFDRLGVPTVSAP